MLELDMIMPSNGNIFRVTGHLCGEFAGYKGQWRGALMFSFICAWMNGWVNNREAGDLRRHRVHYDFIVIRIINTLDETVGWHSATLLLYQLWLVIWISRQGDHQK